MNKKQLRILLSPFIYLGYLLMCIAGLIFPTTLIMMLSFFTFFETLFILFINNFLEEKLTPLDGLFFNKGNPLFQHFLGITVIIWAPFYAAYYFVKEGELIK